MIVAVQVLRRAGDYAITRPAREMLYVVLGREEKYKAKSFVDTVVYRGGDAVSAWAYAGLRDGLEPGGDRVSWPSPSPASGRGSPTGSAGARKPWLQAQRKGKSNGRLARLTDPASFPSAPRTGGRRAARSGRTGCPEDSDQEANPVER